MKEKETEDTFLYHCLREAEKISETFCCYNCELYFRLGLRRSAPYWFDTGELQALSLWTTYLLCSGCGTQHCVIHFPRETMEDCLCFYREGPERKEITTEDLAKRSQWILEQELSRLRNDRAKFQKERGYWAANDRTSVRQPIHVNLLPGKSRSSQTWKTYCEIGLVHVQFVLFTLVMLPFVISLLIGASESPHNTQKLTEEEIQKAREDHEKKLARIREEAEELRRRERINWPLLQTDVVPLHAYLRIMEKIPHWNKVEREIIRREQIAKYEKEVIAMLPCGYCKAKGKMCSMRSKPNCPCCGKAELGILPDRYQDNGFSRTM